MTTTEVENYPGFRDGITGPELMDQMREQALRFGADLRTEDVDEVVTSTARSRRSPSAARPTRPARSSSPWAPRPATSAFPASRSCSARGVSACATCDGFFFRDQDIAVVGGGDSAMEEATFLTRFARSVTLIHRREEFRASKIMLERAKANDEDHASCTNTRGHRGRGRRPGSPALRLRDTVTGEESTLAVTGVFVAIGHDPRSRSWSAARSNSTTRATCWSSGRTTSTSIDGCLRRRRPGRPHLPAGHHRRRQRLLRGDRRRALARRTHD